MGEAKLNQRLGIRRAKTPPDAIFVVTAGVSVHVVHTGPEDPRKAEAINNEMRHDIMRRRGAEARPDIGRIMAARSSTSSATRTPPRTKTRSASS
jgi:hypothetical protein